MLQRGESKATRDGGSSLLLFGICRLGTNKTALVVFSKRKWVVWMPCHRAIEQLRVFA